MSPQASDNDYHKFSFWQSPKKMDYGWLMRQLLGSPNLCSRQWVYRQYDHMVRTNTLTLPGKDAAVVRVKETRRAVAMTLDGHGRYCQIDPRAGVRLIVAEAARNLVCVGAQPLAVTNCLNFASPERPDVMWSFSEVVDGMAEACQVFGTPVTGGNVSFYNETEGKGIYPTPVIGMIGLIEDPSFLTTPEFKDEGDEIVVLGDTGDDLGGSEYLAYVENAVAGPVPHLDLRREQAVQQVCLAAIQNGFIKSAHDCSDGGLAMAVAESCFLSEGREKLGLEVDVEFIAADVPELLLPLVFLFSESPSRIVVSVEHAKIDALWALAQGHGVPLYRLGRVIRKHFRMKINGQRCVDERVETLQDIWRDKLDDSLSMTIE